MTVKAKDNNSLTRARTWLGITVSVIVILGAIAGFIGMRTNDKLEAVSLRIAAADEIAREARHDVDELESTLPAIEARLSTIEANQANLASNQARILSALDALRDD